MEFAFPKTKRLLKTKEFNTVFEQGVKVVTEFLVAFAIPSKKSKVGIVVSKKVGNAVIRNKLKRVLREYYRQFGEEHGESMELIVIARYTAKRAKTQEIDRAFDRSMTKLRRLMQQTRKLEA